MDILNLLGKGYNLVTKQESPKPKKKPSLLKDLINCPDDFELHACVEDGEIVVRLRKKEVESDDK